ncbi:MAG: DUF2207 domain-containing protein [Candidatus Nanopelagicales bacterium]
MKVFGRILVLLAAVVALLWPLVGQAFQSVTETAADDPVTISSYDGALELSAAGELQVTETIVGDLPEGRHGIFRYWDLADPSDPGVRYQPRDLRITRDGAAEPFTTSTARFGRFLVAKVGSADVYLPAGKHTYVLSYRLSSTISAPTAGKGDFTSSKGSNDGPAGSVFYWNVVSQGWEMDIARADVRITLPTATGQVQCSAGQNGQAACQISGAGTKIVTLSASDLPARSGMTVRAAMSTPAPERPGLPWAIEWDSILGRSVPVTAFLGVLAMLGAVVGGLWARRAYEPEPGFPVMYTPPDGLGPAQTVYLATESVGSHALTATILHLADRGFVTLESAGKDDWTITGRTEAKHWNELDPVSRQVGESLGLTQPYRPFAADGKKDSGKVLQDANSQLRSTTATWARESGLVERAPVEMAGKVLVICAAGLAILLSLGQLGPTLLGTPFWMFVLGGLTLLGVGVGLRRTVRGRDQWSRAGGFHRLLSTPSSEDRFDFSARADLFISYVPYAVAFGVADKWAEKYRASTGQEPPVPVWYPMTYSGHAFYSGADSFSSFDTALSSSISAYTASQASSGGGGGFGGGGGGGGGGSW